MNLIDEVRKFEHICWYPSAGADFRALLFFSEAFYSDYSRFFRHSKPYAYPDDAERIVPDLFIFNDREPQNYCYHFGACGAPVWISLEKKADYSRFSEVNKFNHDNQWNMVRTLFKDEKTAVTVIDEPKRFETDAGPAFFMRVKVESKYNGVSREWETNLLYGIAENDLWSSKFLLKNKIPVETFLEVCSEEFIYEGYCQNRSMLAQELGIKYFVLEEHYYDALCQCIPTEKYFYVLQKGAWGIDSFIFWAKRALVTM